jgi:hypothetical protein
MIIFIPLLVAAIGAAIHLLCPDRWKVLGQIAFLVGPFWAVGQSQGHSVSLFR